MLEFKHLESLYTGLKTIDPVKPVIFLAGDSSMDNKFWINEHAEAINNYQHLLLPPVMKTDISYFLNKTINTYHTINCAVEESTISDRKDKLLPQDAFINRKITNNDILIVSIGGNDIALKPCMQTICNMASLTALIP